MDNSDRLHAIILNNPEIFKKDSSDNIMIDLGIANRHSRKTLLHVLIEDEEESKVVEILSQFLEQKRSETEEEATQGTKYKYTNLDVNVQDINGWTPMITAIVNKNPSIPAVTKLMELGYDPFIMSKDGKNAFHWAARVGSADVLKKISEFLTFSQIMMLLNTPTEDHLKMKPISIAAKFDHMEAFAFLCDLEFSTEELSSSRCDVQEGQTDLISHYKRMLEDV